MPNIYILSDEVGFLKACATYAQAKKEQTWWADEGVETTIKQQGYSNDRHSVADLINYYANREYPYVMRKRNDIRETGVIEKKGK